MNIRHQIRFALQDLFPRGATLRGAFYALALVVGLFVPMYSVTLIGCLRYSMEHWQTARLLADKESRRITLERIGNTNDALKEARATARQEVRESANLRFDSVDITYLRSRLAADGWLPEQPKEVHGYNYYAFNFGRLATMTRSTNGQEYARSMDPDDPAFASLSFKWKKTPTMFTEKGEGQVAVSRATYEKLVGVKDLPASGALPVRIGIEYTPGLQGLGRKGGHVPVGNDGIEALEIVGIYEDGSPAVVMTHHFLARLIEQTWYPTDYFHSLYWGPLPANMKPAALVAAIQPQLPKLGLLAMPERLEGKDFLLLSRAEGNGPLTRANWLQNVAARFEAQLPGQFPDAGKASFAHQFPARTPPMREQPNDVLYRRVDITVEDLDQVVILAQAADRMKLARPHSEDRVRNARSVNQQNTAWQSIQFMVLVLTATMAALSLILALRQRIEQKTAEIGIMRAYGARQGLVTSLFNWQAVIVWAAACILAGILTPLTFVLTKGRFLSMTDTTETAATTTASNASTDPFALLHFQQADCFAWHILLIVFGGALAAALACNAYGCRIVSKIQPASALKVQ